MYLLQIYNTFKLSVMNNLSVTVNCNYMQITGFNVYICLFVVYFNFCVRGPPNLKYPRLSRSQSGHYCRRSVKHFWRRCLLFDNNDILLRIGYHNPQSFKSLDSFPFECLTSSLACFDAVFI